MDKDDLNPAGRPKQRVILYELTEEMKKEAQQQLAKDETQLSEEQYMMAENNTQITWDKFYKFNRCNFFRDRTYLEREMPEIRFFNKLFEQSKVVSNYYELGCGVGNTLFPLLRNYDCFRYFGCDISHTAIELIQQQMEKHPELKGKLTVTVCDLAKSPIPFPSVGHLNSLIFVLSAIVPEKHQLVMHKVGESMQPGSFLFFRDYGRYDFGQLNLSSKGFRKLKDNFYRKNDGVCVYYFEEEQLKLLAEHAGLVVIRIRLHCKLLENRKTGLKMHRVWIQGRFYKPPIHQFFIDQIKAHALKEEQTAKEAYQNQVDEEEAKILKEEYEVKEEYKVNEVKEHKQDPSGELVLEVAMEKQ